MSRILPILFNTDMVRALLDGRKTVTRRVIKVPRYYQHLYELHDNTDHAITGAWDCLFAGFYNDRQIFYVDGERHIDAVYYKAPCKTGDILYVRETYCPNYFDRKIMRIAGMFGNGNAYKADYHKEAIGDIVHEPKWTASIHMPKEAARIWLKVTDARAERLQEITPEQSVKEGVDDPYFYISDGGYWEKTGRCNLPCDIAAFSVLWDSTVKKPDLGRYGWEANPWVFVISFERCEKPQK